MKNPAAVTKMKNAVFRNPTVLIRVLRATHPCGYQAVKNGRIASGAALRPAPTIPRKMLLRSRKNPAAKKNPSAIK